MASQTQQVIREALRERGPATLDELVAHLSATGRSPASANPKTTIRNALQNDRACVSTSGKRYVYLPAYVSGAVMRVPIAEPAGPRQPDGMSVLVGSEIVPFLWPGDGARAQREERQVRLALDQGPVVTLAEPRYFGLTSVGQVALTLPLAFWEWWDSATDADALVIRCSDGGAGTYHGEAIRSASIDPQALRERNDALREAAAEVLRRSQQSWGDVVARRIIATGVYHHEPAPDSLLQVLFDPPGNFVIDRGNVQYRPEMTPVFWRVFGHRQERELVFAYGDVDAGMSETGDLVLDTLLHSIDPQLAVVIGEGVVAPAEEDEEEWEEDEAEREEDEAEPRYDSARLDKPPECVYQLKVSLAWMPKVWRVIEILDNQDFVALHLAIQRAFNWDNDHLYSFFMSGRAWDSLTEIAVDVTGEKDPPAVDEIALGDLELQPGQRFLYLFDYGDQLEHEIEVVSILPAPKPRDVAKYPRIVERHGKAPPQYPNWDE